MKKTELYHQNAERAKAQAAFADYGQYLDSLEMTATIKGFEPLYIQRIAQSIFQPSLQLVSVSKSKLPW